MGKSWYGGNAEDAHRSIEQRAQEAHDRMASDSRDAHDRMQRDSSSAHSGMTGNSSLGSGESTTEVPTPAAGSLDLAMLTTAGLATLATAAAVAYEIFRDNE